MIVLGINAFHADSSAALVVDGSVVAAAEEERFCRIKHWAGFPEAAIRYCLGHAGITLADVAHVAVNTDPKAAWGRRLLQVAKRPPTLALIADRLRNRRRRRTVLDELHRVFAGERIAARAHKVPHHLAHLASAHYCSPYETSLAVSVDGGGDFATGAWGLGQGKALTLDAQVWFPHSLGIFYQALTQYIGFPNYGDEYKVMGLAAYGEPAFVDVVRRLVDSEGDGRYRLDTSYFRHERERIVFEWESGVPVFEPLYNEKLVKLLGPVRRKDEPIEQRHKDLARSVQQVFEEAYLTLLTRLHARYRVDSVALAGGCAMNSVANGLVAERTPFRNVYIQAAAGDAGGAIGAALVVANALGARRTEPLLHAQLGPSYDAAACDAAIAREVERIAASACTVDRVDSHEADRRVVGCITNGGVVGWFQGRMEWGPRALGNRSIIADPRRTDMKDILNHKIKRRESFRPFAPSVLREHVSEWFTKDGDVPFMSMVFPIRPEKRVLIPAVTHVDGTGRLQTVDDASNARYAQLIRAFHRATGVPMVLNTSFNENEPIVCRPEEALDCFLRTRMDMLVLGDTVIERKA
jgi:carbamoyltransferase